MKDIQYCNDGSLPCFHSRTQHRTKECLCPPSVLLPAFPSMGTPTLFSMSPVAISCSHFHSLFTSFAILGSVPYTLFGLIGVPLTSFSSTLPNTSSKCSPSPSSSRIAKTRTGSLKIFSSMIPAQVFFRRVVGVEFMASAVTSPMESQQVEEIPK